LGCVHKEKNGKKHNNVNANHFCFASLSLLPAGRSKTSEEKAQPTVQCALVQSCQQQSLNGENISCIRVKFLQQISGFTVSLNPETKDPFHTRAKSTAVAPMIARKEATIADEVAGEAAGDCVVVATSSSSVAAWLLGVGISAGMGAGDGAASGANEGASALARITGRTLVGTYWEGPPI
jgi:hypothetical protein